MAFPWRLNSKVSLAKSSIFLATGLAVVFFICLAFRTFSSASDGFEKNFFNRSGVRSFQNNGENYDKFKLLKTKKLSPVSLFERGQMYLKSGINVVIIFTNAAENWNLREKLSRNIESLLFYSSTAVTFYFIGDEFSQDIASEIVKKHTPFYRMVRLDMSSVVRTLRKVISPMQQHFSYKPGAYYNNELFFLSLAIHWVLPSSIDRLIMLDVDLIFKDDIQKLYDEFDKFDSKNLIGLAQEQQPVYRHAFWKYRKMHPNTRVGEPPPEGLTGFNSGVVLLSLKRMRKSKLYNQLLSLNSVKSLTEKFMFKGHLGDQDFFSIVGMEHKELFHILPCSWNRQLCQWWKDKGYENIFDSYHNCNRSISIFHGNCHTKIRF